MTKHRHVVARSIGGGSVRGSPLLTAHQASRRCRCCGDGGGRNTPRARARDLDLSFSLYRHCERRRLSLFRDIRSPTSPRIALARCATERKHLDILEYDHCVNIRLFCPPRSRPFSLSLSLALSLTLFLSLPHSAVCRLPFSSFFFFLMRALRAGQRSTGSFPQFGRVSALPVHDDGNETVLLPLRSVLACARA